MRHSRDRRLVILIIGLGVIFLLLPFWLGTPGAAALANPCALDPENLIFNGSMAAAVPDQGVAAGWHSFTLGGDPMFEHVDNEQIDLNGSQYIWDDIDRFDAGIYQTVTGLQPGTGYHFWLGYALAAYDPGDTVNHRGDWIGRQVGYDLTGGTDPQAGSVMWGDVYCDGLAALNIPALDKNFVATTDRTTIFLRAINAKEASIRNKVWFDSACMEKTVASATLRTPIDDLHRIFFPFVVVSPPPSAPSCLAGITAPEAQ